MCRTVPSLRVRSPRAGQDPATRIGGGLEAHCLRAGYRRRKVRHGPSRLQRRVAELAPLAARRGEKAVYCRSDFAITSCRRAHLKGCRDKTSACRHFLPPVTSKRSWTVAPCYPVSYRTRRSYSATTSRISPSWILSTITLQP